ncbi:PAS domain S-box protein [bacterium]|jgi:PAS domain S-box-containing protein|nr:PAS domain S-box protein [bacterium]
MAQYHDSNPTLDFEKERLTLEVLEQEDFASMLIRSSNDGIHAYDQDCRFTLWNPVMERITGVPASQVIGRRAFDLFPFLVKEGVDQSFYSALSGRPCEAKGFNYTIPHTGRQGVFDHQHAPLRDETGKVVGGFAIVSDVTGQENTFKSLRLLSATMDVLSSSMDRDATLSAILKLSSRAFNGWCCLRLSHLDLPEREHDHYIEHSDEMLSARLRKINENYLVSPVKEPHTTEWMPYVSKDTIRFLASNQEHFEILLSLNIKSYICMPLLMRDRVVGYFSIVSSERSLRQSDFSMATEMGRLLAIGLDGGKFHR